jgi:hypothetical protein
MTPRRLFFSYGVAGIAFDRPATPASIPAMSVRRRCDRLPLAIFADAKTFFTAFQTDGTGHLLLAAEIGGALSGKKTLRSGCSM